MAPLLRVKRRDSVILSPILAPFPGSPPEAGSLGLLGRMRSGSVRVVRNPGHLEYQSGLRIRPQSLWKDVSVRLLPQSPVVIASTGLQLRRGNRTSLGDAEMGDTEIQKGLEAPAKQEPIRPKKQPPFPQAELGRKTADSAWAGTRERALIGVGYLRFRPREEKGN